MTNWREQLNKPPAARELDHPSLRKESFAWRTHGRGAAAIRDHIVRIYEVDPEPSAEIKRVINSASTCIARDWEVRGPQSQRPREEDIPAIRQAVARSAQDYWEAFHLQKQLEYATVRPGQDRYGNPKAARILGDIYMNRVTNHAQKRLEESGLTPTAAFHTNAYIIKNTALDAGYRLQFNAHVDPPLSPAIDEKIALNQLKALDKYWQLGVAYLKRELPAQSPTR